MKERGIIFSGEMVRAILEGRKTQTRRVMKMQPSVFNEHELWWHGPAQMTDIGPTRAHSDFGFRIHAASYCPYGIPGDRLYVRETTWRDGGYVERDEPTYKNEGKVPAIFMRKVDARIWLEILSVRVERVQGISEDDARAEGVRRWFPVNKSLRTADEVVKRGLGKEPGSYRNGFHDLWDSINGKREGCAWKDNPWVWVVEFKPLEGK